MQDKTKYLIINGDGYGFTDGINRAYDDCLAFGTVSSLSVNVNCPYASSIAQVAQRYPSVSIGCHLNPIVGTPVSSLDKVPSLVNNSGELYYKEFAKRWLKGLIDHREMKTELTAQINLLKSFVGSQFSHVDFHMGLQRLPKLYPIFLDVVEESGAGRVRTERIFYGIDADSPRLTHTRHLLLNPANLAKYLLNYYYRQVALQRGLASPHRKVAMIHMHGNLERITTDNFIKIIRNIPPGYNELIVHPAYIDDDLIRWSTLVKPRELMLKVLMDQRFKDALLSSDAKLVGYREIPVENRLNGSKP